MSFTTQWSPNQAATAQVETYTFTVPTGVGNTYNATTNGKTVTYRSVSGDTAASVATGLYTLLVASGIAEMKEISFANPSSAVVTATARTPGVPFANVPGTSAGLVMSTGNGLVNGIATVHTTANTSPSDVNDAQNWLRCNLSSTPPATTRSLPQNGDDVVVGSTSVPMQVNLDQLASVQFNTYQRWQSMAGDIGLPQTNPNGYAEWRACYFKMGGPTGSVPAGGLTMTLGYDGSINASGAGPSREFYDLGSQLVTLNILAGGSPAEDYGVRFLCQHTASQVNLSGGVSMAVAMQANEKAVLFNVKVESGVFAAGPNVTWISSASNLVLKGGSAIVNSTINGVSLANGSGLSVTTDGITITTLTAQGSCLVSMLAGGTITTLTLSNRSSLDKSGDGRSLTITNHTIDGDSCIINDPLNTITFTNAGTVNQNVASGPYRFTGPRTVKVT